jgi:hypothetical protein
MNHLRLKLLTDDRSEEFSPDPGVDWALAYASGQRPRVFTWAFLAMLFTGRVSDRFQFVLTRSYPIGYRGRARKVA